MKEAILTIDKQAAGGHGLARYEGNAILVPEVATGEKVRCQLLGKRKGVHWGQPLEILEPNPLQRRQPKCQHFRECGGCSYQHLTYEAQVSAKEDILRELFGCHSSPPELLPTIASPQEWAYRNKCQFTFGRDESGKLSLGMHPPGKYFRVLDIRECWLLPDPVFELIETLGDFARASGLGPYEDLRDAGFWHTLTIRYSFSTGLGLAILAAKDIQDHPILAELDRVLRERHPWLQGLLVANAPRGEVTCWRGYDSLKEECGGLELVYGASSFFQVNPPILSEVLEALSEAVLGMEPSTVYDLFGGVGTLGLAVAQRNQRVKVVGAESDAEACSLAGINGELNDQRGYEANHLNLFAKGWGEYLRSQGAGAGPGCLVVDPPRAGLAKRTVREIGKMSPDRIVYMSCNPATQRRDVELLGELGYELKSLRLVDMFPQTKHLESLAVMDL